MEGLRPQTIESLQTLKETKTPFVIAGNISRSASTAGAQHMDVRSWNRSKTSAKMFSLCSRTAIGSLVSQFSEHGFNIERYDQIRDFRQNVALVPMSAKDGEGLQDLLAVTVGLAERFLEDRLTDTLGTAEGTVLEMRDEVGMGKTIDVILYRGELKNWRHNHGRSKRRTIFETHIKGLKRPKGMSEMRDAGKRWVNFDKVEAACGVKIVAPKLENTIAGTTLYRANTEEEREQAETAIRQEWRAIFDTMPIMCSKCNEVFPRADFKDHTRREFAEVQKKNARVWSSKQTRWVDWKRLDSNSQN